MSEEKEKCAFCGCTVESPCESVPAGICSKAMDETHGSDPTCRTPRGWVQAPLTFEHTPGRPVAWWMLTSSVQTHEGSVASSTRIAVSVSLPAGRIRDMASAILTHAQNTRHEMCTCVQKGNVAASHHDLFCPYRLAVEATVLLDDLSSQVPK